MKKVVLMYDFLSELGGLERMMFRHSNWLSETYQSTLAFASVNKKTEEILRKDFDLKKNIPIIEFSKLKFNEIFKILSLIFSKKEVLKQKPDLLISYSFLCSYLCYLINKKYKIPYVIVLCHPPNFLYFDSIKDRITYANNLKRVIAVIFGLFFNPILKKMDVKAVKNANLVFPISDYTRRRAVNIYGNRDYTILYPPLADIFKIIKKENLNSSIEKYNIKNQFIYATGRIIQDKKFEWIIEAFNKLQNKNYDLIISGMISDSYKEKLLNLIKKLNLEKKARVLGPIPKEDLISLYNLASVFVLSAPKEDFGLVPIESIACGTPVAAWNDNAGPNETITNKITGLFAKPYDTIDLAKTTLKATQLKKNNKNFEKYIKEFRTESVKKVLFDSIKKVI